MAPRNSTASVGDTSTTRYVVGLDVGSETCTVGVLTPDKRVVLKPFDIANAGAGFDRLHQKLAQLAGAPHEIVVGREATGRYWENVYYFLQARGYRLVLLHPAQTHHFAQRRGLRAKTDKLDALTIARALLSDDVRPAYVPNELTATYRELVRLHSNLSDEAARYKQEIQDLLVVLFPEFTQIFKDPTRKTALAVLRAYPSAQAIAAVGDGPIAAVLQATAPRNFGPDTAARLVALAQRSSASPLAVGARSRSLAILADQLTHTQVNLAELEREIDALVRKDDGAAGLRSVPDFGPTTVAVLRGELGEVERFQRSEQVVAYAGLDVTVRESGKWKGQRKLSKRGSGALRRSLYMAAFGCLRHPHSAFRAYYEALAARGLKGNRALVAVMRKMLVVAYHLLRSGEPYDPAKVWAGVHTAGARL
ncbi:MAG: IS110 family transposase [Chloroflexota bacterium]|nr:IS110 family transposase [Chloroflexota bacterium]